MSEPRPPQAPAPDSANDDGSGQPDVRSLALALVGTFVLRASSYAAGIMIPIFLGLKSRTDHDVTAGLAGLVAVTFYASELIGAPIFGAWSDRFGRKPFMLLGPILGGIAVQLMGFAAAIPVLVIVRMLQGCSTATAAPATLGFLSAHTATSEKLRGRIMGLYEAATVVGLAGGAAVGGRLYENLGVGAFTVVAGLYLVAVIPFAWLHDTRPAAPAVHHHSVLAGMFNRRIMRFAPAWLAANAVLGAWFSVGPFLAAAAPNKAQFLMRGFAPGEIGMAYLAFGIIFTAGAITWGFVMPSIGRQATLLIGVAGLGFASASLWALNHMVSPRVPEALIVVLIGLVIVGIFVESGFTPAALAYLAEIAEERPGHRGSVMGLYSVLLSIGQLLGGALAAPFADRLGINGLIILTGLLCLVALFTVMLLGHAERRYTRGLATAAPATPAASPSTPAV